MAADAGRATPAAARSNGQPKSVRELRPGGSYTQAIDNGADEPARAPVAGRARTFVYRGAVLASERELLIRFLDDFRAAESFGATVLGLWADVATHPVVRGGLRTICAREARHGELLAERLQELGGECRAELDRDLREAARARLASTSVSDGEKLAEMVARYSDVDVAVQPMRDVLYQIEDDLETKALLQTILEEEIATLRWLKATSRDLGR